MAKAFKNLFGFLVFLFMAAIVIWYLVIPKINLNKMGNSGNQQEIQITETISPPNSITPTTEITNSYSNPLFGISFDFDPNYGVMDNINDSSALKADRELWVAVPGSDQLILELYVYQNQGYGPEDWWKNVGLLKFNKLQEDYYASSSPTSSPLPSPTFNQETGNLAGKSALIFKGSINAPQREGENKITLVLYRNQIYMFVQQKDVYERSNKILSTLRFIDE